MTKQEHLDQSDPYGGLCNLCGNRNHPYTMQNRLWSKLIGPVRESTFVRVDGKLKQEGGFYVCIPCFEDKLGRASTEEDFIDAPINHGIFGFDCKVYCSLKN